MALSSVGTRGWAARPWQSKASVSVASATIDVPRMLELATAGARGIEDDRGWVTVGPRTPVRVDFLMRDLAKPEAGEIMRFRVEAERAAGRVTARSAIESFTVKDSGVGGLVPVANRRLIGFSAYQAFMDRFAAMVQADDIYSVVSFTSGR